ncbi:YxiJ-like protein [Terribacillus saccharophilus]|uniref:YxiJ-like protein n=1 Tax=Terribacillus saccharophilus TaxID=361277 RepID=A0AAX2E8Y1_9BACI|nr:YxiJ-like protein [Terribacillus saccharophilus]
MKEGKYFAMPISYHRQLVQAVVKERWIKTTGELLALRLMEPFPYTDLGRMIADHSMTDELDLADWNAYWMEIAGAVYHLRRSKLPEKRLIYCCNLNFFSQHPECGNQNEVLSKEYPEFAREFREYERARFYVLFFYYKWASGQKYLNK